MTSIWPPRAGVHDRDVDPAQLSTAPGRPPPPSTRGRVTSTGTASIRSPATSRQPVLAASADRDARAAVASSRRQRGADAARAAGDPDTLPRVAHGRWSAICSIADRAAAEAGLAVGKVELPRPPERVVEAQPAHVVPAIQEPLAPQPERGRVVLADLVAGGDPQRARPRSARRRSPARMGSVRRGRCTCGPRCSFAGSPGTRPCGIVIVCRLMRPPGCSSRSQIAEELGPVLLAHRLEHLDRDDLVERPCTSR